MDTMIMWGGYVIAVIVAIVAAIILQKKGVENSLNLELAEKRVAELSLLEKELSEAKHSLVSKERELNVALQDRDGKASKLETLKNDFESQMDDIVQSSIQKISHSEQAKEEAVKAAGDNYEAAAEAYGQIKEKDKIIADLQKQLKG